MKQEFVETAQMIASSDPIKVRSKSDAIRKLVAEHEVIFGNAVIDIASVYDRMIMRCNRRFEELFGYGSGELNSLSMRILYPSDDDYEHIGLIRYEYLLTHNSYSDERMMWRKSGETFWCSVALKSLDPAEPQRGAIAIFRDVSERNASEDALLGHRSRSRIMVSLSRIPRSRSASARMNWIASGEPD